MLRFMWNLVSSRWRSYSYDSELQLTEKNTCNRMVSDDFNENNDITDNSIERVNLNDNGIQVNYGRPILREMSDAFKDSSPVDEVSDLNLAAVVVCGSSPLVLSASKEVRQTQQQVKQPVNHDE